MFQALYELCQTATLALTISAGEDGRLTVNVVPKPKKDAGEAALAAPLSLTATPQEFDEGFVAALQGYAAKRASLLEQVEATNEVLDAATSASAKKAAEAARTNMVTRAKIEQAMPAWVFARRRPLGAVRLRAIARATSDAFAATVARAILRLRRIQVPAFPFEPEGEFVDFAAVASWREDDIVVRVLDDLLQLAGETECCDISGYVRFDPAEPHAFGQWMKRMTPFLKATAALDHLLWLLAAADYGQGGR